MSDADGNVVKSGSMYKAICVSAKYNYMSFYRQSVVFVTTYGDNDRNWLLYAKRVYKTNSNVHIFIRCVPFVFSL